MIVHALTANILKVQTFNSTNPTMTKATENLYIILIFNIQYKYRYHANKSETTHSP